MNEFLEILKTILPSIITGIITFLITKYTYNNNRPLDKLEIAYNEIYYPLSQIIKCNNIDLVITSSKFYINKFYKYADYSTIKIFKRLCDCNTNFEKKEAFEIFKSNIYNRCSYLRRKLGYLEPSILQIYKYLTKSEKSTFRILFELLFIYIFSSIGNIATKDIILIICFIIAAIFLLIVVIELLCKFSRFIYFKIKK